MSEPMSKTEIEDVLSSIRRLVTEDHRPQQRLHAPLADKLVLTPALRIQPARSDAGKPFGAAEPLRLVAARAPDRAASPSHQAAAVLEAALQGHRDDWEPDGTEGTPSVAWSVDWDAADGEGAETAGSASSALPGAGAADTLSFPDLGADRPAEETSSEDDIWDDFLAEHRSAPLLAAGQADPWRPAQGRGPKARTAEGAGQIETASNGQGEPAPAHGLTGLAVPVSVSRAELADDGPDSPWPPTRSADPSGVRLQEGLSDPVPQEDPPGIDERLLRDLVREVLREELQGELGERITRNVRKMVRAELARALTARDLI